MSDALAMRVLRGSAMLALVALGLIAWGVLDPRPIALVVALSVGQAFGTLSFAGFLVVVLFDLRRARVLGSSDGDSDTES